MRTSRKVNAYEVLCAIQDAVIANHENMRDEPESDGTTHDKWEEEDDALTELEDSLEGAVASFDSAVEVRRSLARMTVEI